MEVKVVYSNGTVETHRMPDICGETLSMFDRDTGREIGRCATDLVSDIVERFELTDDGFVLSRYVASEDLEGFTPISPLRRCVVPMRYLAYVKRVLVDDEEVWPNDASKHNDVARLDKGF